MKVKTNPCSIKSGFPRGMGTIIGGPKKIILLCALFFIFLGGLYAQTEFPAGDFWSLDAGLGMANFGADGLSFGLDSLSFQGIFDPKLWLSPSLMVGSKLGVNYSFPFDGDNDDNDDDEYSDILTFEGQVYIRWNFLRLGKNPEKTINLFVQGGLGMVAAYRGDANPFDNEEKTRGSLLADAALGVTIPLTERWHIEPQVRGGFPHLFGFSITAGYKFPLPKKVQVQEVTRIEYRDIIRSVPPEEIVKRIMITSVEYILFGPDIGTYNTGVDHDAGELNDLVLNEIARLLKEDPQLRVRIEGHANPVTTDPAEADELMTLSALRADAVAEQLRNRGIPDEQTVVISFGGTRTVTSDREIWGRNRRVELIVIRVDTSDL